MTKKELIQRISELRASQVVTRKRYFEEEWGVGVPKPGTRAFGQRAESRREGIRERASKGDMRVQTAYKKVTAGTKAKNKIISGD